MAKTKKENLKDMTEVELNKKLATLRENVRVMRFKAEGSKSKNVKESANLRKEIARILTALNGKK
jgi:ribosomal protein L29